MTRVRCQLQCITLMVMRTNRQEFSPGSSPPPPYTTRVDRSSPTFFIVMLFRLSVTVTADILLYVRLKSNFLVWQKSFMEESQAD